MRSSAFVAIAAVFSFLPGGASVLDKKAAFERNLPLPLESVQLTFEGVDGCDVYNCSVPFLWNGRTCIFGRVERRDKWACSRVALFREVEKDRFSADRNFQWLELEDPYLQEIGGVPVLGGTFVTKVAGTVVDYRGRFYRGAIDALSHYTTGPELMKDIRLVETGAGRIGVFSRPRGASVRVKYGSESVIGYVEIRSLADLTPETISAAPVIGGVFGTGEWGGCNQCYLLRDGKIGVAGHICAEGPAAANGKPRQIYCVAAFVFDPETHRVSEPKIIATRRMFPWPGAKVSHLDDCVFTSGFVFNRDGSVDVYAGVGDMSEGRVRIGDGASVFGSLPVRSGMLSF